MMIVIFYKIACEWYDFWLRLFTVSFDYGVIKVAQPHEANGCW